MKYYVDPSNQQVYAYEEDGSQDSFIGSTLQLLTDVELAAIRAIQNPTPVVSPVITITSTRYTHETAGFIWNGVFIDTSANSYAKIIGARSAAQDGLREDPSIWKCADPTTKDSIYRSTTNAEMIDISNKTYAYVQACYTRESVLMTAVEAGTFTADMLTQGWPTQL